MVLGHSEIIVLWGFSEDGRGSLECLGAVIGFYCAYIETRFNHEP